MLVESRQNIWFPVSFQNVKITIQTQFYEKETFSLIDVANRKLIAHHRTKKWANTVIHAVKSVYVSYYCTTFFCGVEFLRSKCSEKIEYPLPAHLLEIHNKVLKTEFIMQHFHTSNCFRSYLLFWKNSERYIFISPA
jgi:hypothetical protein